MAECIQTVADNASRSKLRSANSTLYVTLQLRIRFGERAYLYAGPASWNSLPAEIRDNADLPAFRNKLKIHFLNLVYS